MREKSIKVFFFLFNVKGNDFQWSRKWEKAYDAGSLKKNIFFSL